MASFYLSFLARSRLCDVRKAIPRAVGDTPPVSPAPHSDRDALLLALRVVVILSTSYTTLRARMKRRMNVITAWKCRTETNGGVVSIVLIVSFVRISIYTSLRKCWELSILIHLVSSLKCVDFEKNNKFVGNRESYFRHTCINHAKPARFWGWGIIHECMLKLYFITKSTADTAERQSLVNSLHAAITRLFYNYLII